MKTKITKLSILFILLISQVSFAQSKEEIKIDALILKFKTSNKPNSKTVLKQQKFKNSNIKNLNESNNISSIKLTGNKKKEDTYIINISKSNTSIEKLIEAYNETGLFEYVEPDYIGYGHGAQSTPNDGGYFRNWQHYNDGSFAPSASTIVAKEDADMDTDLAWDITQGDPNIVIAMLDSGAKLDHPEFSGRIWTNSNETEDGIDTDQNNYTDDRNGWDFVNNDNDPTDDHGHGTTTAGIAGATGNNSVGFAGMNWNSKIMVCKILNASNSGKYSNWAEAIYYAVDNGASVINMSVGGTNASTTLEEAIDYAYAHNVPVVASAGNQNSSTLRYPAKYTKTIAVGATNSDDTRSATFSWGGGSNYGPELDFVAPGNYIFCLNYLNNTKYNTFWSGTSQAAPQVTGLISLILSVNKDLTITQINTILKETSEDLIGDADDTEGWDQYYGYGRVNAYQALLETNKTLSINSFYNLKNNLSVYPNPISNNNTLKISNLDNEEYLLEIYNLLGQNVYRKNVSVKNKVATINIINLNSGTYLLKVKNRSTNTSAIKKLLIQ